MKKPLIGVLPLWDDGKQSLWMLPGYFAGLQREGALPVMLPLAGDEPSLRRMAETFDGFLFTGGQDVQPSVYGEEQLPLTGEICPDRDGMETALLPLLLEAGKPVLGICRGIQILNAALGGTLWQDLPAQHPSDVEHHQGLPYNAPSHTVALVPGTPLHALLGEKTLPVNSLHHQGIKTLAPALRAMAAAPDGLVEAVYMPGKRFVWAVQWHPEYSLDQPASRAILRAFVRAAQADPAQIYPDG